MVTRIAPGYPVTKKNVVKKYIKIPKYAPLYAMVKCNGPTTAPIKTPIAVPVEIIGELLAQKFNTPEIYEVIPIDIGHGKYTRPIRLTLENYTKPYSELSAGLEPSEVKVVDTTTVANTNDTISAAATEPELTKDEIEALKADKFATPSDPVDVPDNTEPEIELEPVDVPQETAEETPEVEEPIADATIAQALNESDVVVIPSSDTVTDNSEETSSEAAEEVTPVTEVDVIPKTENVETINHTTSRKKKKNRHN